MTLNKPEGWDAQQIALLKHQVKHPNIDDYQVFTDSQIKAFECLKTCTKFTMQDEATKICACEKYGEIASVTDLGKCKWEVKS